MKPATTITKVCRVLAEFRNRPCIGVTELARKTQLLPSDVHRILTSLQSCGFVEQNAQTKAYRLGVATLKLGLAAFQRSPVREAAVPLLLRLSDQMEATAHMAMFDSRDLDIFLAHQVDARDEVPFKSRLGAYTSPHCTALGKTIVANIDRDMALLALQKYGMPRATLRTITRLPEIEAQLNQIRDQGYAVDIEECTKGACCIGAPVRDASGETVGAISVSMSAARFHRSPEADLALAVKATAAELSAAIGYCATPPVRSPRR